MTWKLVVMMWAVTGQPLPEEDWARKSLYWNVNRQAEFKQADDCLKAAEKVKASMSQQTIAMRSNAACVPYK